MSPALFVHIQAHLDEDLSLEALSAKASLSPAHFQRTFQKLVGETPKNYVARLRLERAAFRLLIHDATLLDIALDCGFQNHETFHFRNQDPAAASGASGIHSPCRSL